MKKLLFAAIVIGLIATAHNAREIREYLKPELKEARLSREKENEDLWIAEKVKENESREEKLTGFFISEGEDRDSRTAGARSKLARKSEFAGRCEFLARSVARYGASFNVLRKAQLTAFEEDGENRIHYKTTFNLKNAFGATRKASLACTGDEDGRVIMAWVNGQVVLK